MEIDQNLNYSFMNSSTGFKKRSILRPPSGISRERQYLKVVDIGQSESLISSTIRTQVAGIQEQINLLDKDKRIRAGEVSLQKSYVVAFKKWLNNCQLLTEKEDDDARLLKFMGVDSYETGFKKLWKVLSNLDIMVSKITQLQIIQFLKYDELFNQLTEDSPRSTNFLTSIGQSGYNPSSFQITQVLLERNKDIYGCKSTSTKKPATTNKSETTELITQLQKQNAKLVNLLDQLQQQSVKSSQKTESEAPKARKSGDIFSELEEKYHEEIRRLKGQIEKLESDNNELNIKLGNVESQLKAVQGEMALGEFKPNTKVAVGTYEEALLEEMQKMKRGFERKIKIITEDFNGKERDMRKKENQCRTECERLRWEKNLLMKKFDTLSK